MAEVVALPGMAYSRSGNAPAKTKRKAPARRKPDRGPRAAAAPAPLSLRAPGRGGHAVRGTTRVGACATTQTNFARVFAPPRRSLFKFVTEDVVLQEETLQQELATEEALAAQLESEQVAHDAADAAQQTKRVGDVDAGAHLVTQLAKASESVDAVLPLVERLGLLCMEASKISLPQHMQGQAVAPPAVPAFLAFMEDALHAVMNRAKAVVQARAPRKPETEEEAKAFALQPPEEVSPTLAILRGAAGQRVLASGKDAAKMLHNDSSERLLQMA